MKKLLKIALVAVGMLMTAGLAKAQTKIGYLNFNALVGATTEIKSIQTQIDQYQGTFVETLKSMNTELQSKAQDYEAKRATMTDAVRTKTEGELQDLQKRIQEYQNNASNQVQQKYNDLTKPLVDKLKAGVNAVAKEKGYTFVFDTSQTEMLVAPDADDLTAAVKAKLNIGSAPAAAKPAPKR